MKKIIELLNQFEKDKQSGWTWRSIDSYDNCIYGVDCDGETEITMYSDLYSKYYGFIERLIDNDKIDFKNNKLQVLKDLITNGNQIYDFEVYSDYDSLLMVLSIQDSPIDFLISILR